MPSSPAPVALASCELVAHPRTTCAVVDAVNVDFGASAELLVVRYSIVGDLDRLRIPAWGDTLDPERLWEHTCCELFVATEGADDYVEWNFSPTGQITRFAFVGYRERTESSPSPRGATASSSRLGRALELEAAVPWPRRGIARGAASRISPTIVIEDTNGVHSYWALHHPSERPDFHHRGGFALALTLGPPVAIVAR